MTKRKSSHEEEKISTQAQARSPEVDELSCVLEHQQSQQAAGVEELVVNWYKISVHSIHIRPKFYLASDLTLTPFIAIGIQVSSGQ